MLLLRRDFSRRDCGDALASEGGEKLEEHRRPARAHKIALRAPYRTGTMRDDVAHVARDDRERMGRDQAKRYCIISWTGCAIMQTFNIQRSTNRRTSGSNIPPHISPKPASQAVAMCARNGE